MARKIIPIKQPNPDDCWASCLSMIFSSHGVATTTAEIEDFAIKDADGSSFLTELARFAKTKGFEADCFAYNLIFSGPEFSKLGPSALISAFEEQRGKLGHSGYELMLDSTIKAMQMGVNYKIRKPLWSDIKSYLDRDIPLIVSVNYAALHDQRGDPYEAHDVVVTKTKGEKVSFVDPLHEKEQTILIEELLFAMHQRKVIAASAYFLAIYPLIS